MNLIGKAWKRQINKVTFVGDNFTRKPPKYERFAHFPTEEDIVKKAKTLNQFVSSKGSEL